jgi:serine/threonine protein kinase
VIEGLDRDRWTALSPYLDEALDLEGADRAAWLEALHAREPGLAAEVEALLAEFSTLEREDFLGRAPGPRSTLAGQALGAYTLREQIGQGGMGSVWLAERSDGSYEGVAAVKLLNVSLIGNEAEERFRREGSILARLRHAHIARLVDAGVSPAGQPYLVLEHVGGGEHLDAYCDRHRLTVEARVRLFRDVVAAVAHAHANLIVHRDLKPSNVLVDGEGSVKLLDFGVAKLLAPDAATAPTAVTREGSSVLTPEYATPEQLTGGDITTATDVFALGVLLYGLLAGRHPAGPDNYAIDLIRLARYGDARAVLERALALARRHRTDLGVVFVSLQLAQACLASGDLACVRQSLHQVETAPPAAVESSSQRIRGDVVRIRALLAAAKGRDVEAHRLMLEARDLHESMRMTSPGQVNTLLELARIEMRLGRPQDAEATARSALARAQRMGSGAPHSSWVGQSLLALGVARKARGDAAGARVAFAQALEQMAPTLGLTHPAVIEARQALAR